MWRLIATIVAVTGNGGLAISTDHSDWPTQAACQHIVETMYNTPPTATLGGVNVTIRTRASCVPLDGGPGPAPGVVDYKGPPIPPPVAELPPGDPRDGYIPPHLSFPRRMGNALPPPPRPFIPLPIRIW